MSLLRTTTWRAASHEGNKKSIFTISRFETAFTIQKQTTLEYEKNELKTNELRSKYADKIVGSWWQERIDENDKAFEQLNLSAEGTLTGYIKWLHRKKVMVSGEEVWTDWETEVECNYSGSWNLFWKDGQSYINILAKVEGSNYYWYSTDMVFNGICQKCL